MEIPYHLHYMSVYRDNASFVKWEVRRGFVSKIFRFHLKQYMRQLKQGILGLFYFSIWLSKSNTQLSVTQATSPLKLPSLLPWACPQKKRCTPKSLIWNFQTGSQAFGESLWTIWTALNTIKDKKAIWVGGRNKR